ncbi:Dyp-type peroxidase [Occultella gossypii]|uniref:Dyp-type peroxidase n=1 Tax=Occultella gossypii TaxID=2800820 RepID=A0ABS7SAG9_9MICO|nr:Dyp-type peroxidase [Occultella gossypii]MBZ2196750.1 Dyp-type peroxidase [Occultella gossypii]
MADTEGTAPGRRQVLRGLAGVGLGGIGGIGAGLVLGSRGARGAESGSAEPGDTGTPEAPGPVPVHGATQAGVDRPGTPQRHGSIAVLDLDAATTAAEMLALCADLGTLITALTTATSPPHPALPDGPGDLTITVGLGPRLVRLLGPDLPGAEDLPAFAGDTELDPSHSGGDLFLAAYSHDPNDADTALTEVSDAVGHGVLRWAQRGFRAHGTGTVARNPLGFHDGVIVPRGEEELAEHVWLPDGPAAGGTIAVVRRLRVDTATFRAEPVPDRERVIGREHATGAPLSGGGPMDEVDLLAKTPEGEFRIPARSHARAAHPSFTGSHLMLRRGYAFDNGRTPDGVADAGLLFICFQRDLRTFAATQHRLDEVDDLMTYVTTTASATFLVLPGFDAEHPLGATLG